MFFLVCRECACSCDVLLLILAASLPLQALMLHNSFSVILKLIETIDVIGQKLPDVIIIVTAVMCCYIMEAYLYIHLLYLE